MFSKFFKKRKRETRKGKKKEQEEQKKAVSFSFFTFVLCAAAFHGNCSISHHNFAHQDSFCLKLRIFNEPLQMCDLFVCCKTTKFCMKVIKNLLPATKNRHHPSCVQPAFSVSWTKNTKLTRSGTKMNHHDDKRLIMLAEWSMT